MPARPKLPVITRPGPILGLRRSYLRGGLTPGLLAGVRERAAGLSKVNLFLGVLRNLLLHHRKCPRGASRPGRPRQGPVCSHPVRGTGLGRLKTGGGVLVATCPPKQQVNKHYVIYMGYFSEVRIENAQGALGRAGAVGSGGAMYPPSAGALALLI